MPSAAFTLAAEQPSEELHSAAFGVLHSGPSHRHLRHRYAITCCRRAPPPTRVRGWTRPPEAVPPSRLRNARINVRRPTHTSAPAAVKCILLYINNIMLYTPPKTRVVHNRKSLLFNYFPLTAVPTGTRRRCSKTSREGMSLPVV